MRHLKAYYLSAIDIILSGLQTFAIIPGPKIAPGNSIFDTSYLTFSRVEKLVIKNDLRASCTALSA